MFFIWFTTFQVAIGLYPYQYMKKNRLAETWNVLVSVILHLKQFSTHIFEAFISS